METLRKRKWYIVGLAVIFASIVGGYFLFFHVPAVCAGKPQEVHWEEQTYFTGRSVRVNETDNSGRHWVGFGDGGLGVMFEHRDKLYAEVCGAGPEQSQPGQEAQLTVNAILVVGDVVYFGTDRAGLWKYEHGRLTEYPEMRDIPIYDLAYAQREGFFAATLTGLYRLNDGKWSRATFLEPPFATRFHAVAIIDGEYWLGGLGDGMYHRTAGVDGVWTRYDSEGVWSVEAGQWVRVEEGSYPDNIRSIALTTSSSAESAPVLAYVATDDDTNGLMAITTEGLTIVPNTRLNHLVRVNLIGEDVIVNDWQFGTARLSDNNWEVLTSTPSFDADFYRDDMLIATANGVLHVTD